LQNGVPDRGGPRRELCPFNKESMIALVCSGRGQSDARTHHRTVQFSKSRWSRAGLSISERSL